MYAVRVAVSHNKRVEMGLKSIETSEMYSEVYVKTVFRIIEMPRDKLCSHKLLVLGKVRCSCCLFSQ